MNTIDESVIASTWWVECREEWVVNCRDKKSRHGGSTRSFRLRNLSCCFDQWCQRPKRFCTFEERMLYRKKVSKSLEGRDRIHALARVVWR